MLEEGEFCLISVFISMIEKGRKVYLSSGVVRAIVETLAFRIIVISDIFISCPTS